MSRDPGRGAEAPGNGGAGVSGGPRSTLVEWMERHGFLRGPFVYGDYWASVLRFEDAFPDRLTESGLVDPTLYRVGLDRPDLEIPALRHYLLLFLLGPFLLALRRFRRLGRQYRLSYRSELGREVERRLHDLRLELAPAGGEEGRVHVEKDGRRLASHVLDPRRVPGFASFFHATYKLPLASFTAILVVGVVAPLLHAAGALGPVLEYWIPVGFPVLVALVYLVYRDLVTAVLGALPVVVGRFLVPLVGPDPGGSWGAFLAALGGLFLLYLLIDWLFMPRPVPPVLMLYTDEGPARTYDREEDAPWWLEGEAYWVWRYLVLTPAELNKFWERDWERVELWIRADGDAAGDLEWVVTDAHYRELWLPGENLATPDRHEEDRREARKAVEAGRAGFWLVETDADLVFHTPVVRTLSYMPEEEDVAVQGTLHFLSGLWKRSARHDPAPYREALERVQLREGKDVFEDVPEATARMVARHLLSIPWRYWRYPLGAASSRPNRVYGGRARRPAAPAADPSLQVKDAAPEG